MSTDPAILQALLADASLEASPRWVVGQPAVLDWLPAGTQVYLPHHPGADYRHTVDAAATLTATGLRPVPHFPVRSIGSTAEARRRLAALAGAGANALLLIAGDDDHPAGPYASTMDLLEAGLLVEHGFHSLGVAGHPEGHSRVSSADLLHALAVKRDYAVATGTAMWVVTQFLFSADSALAWLRRMREIVDPLPIRMGLPGPTSLSTLLGYAKRCGVGASARFFVRRMDTVRLLGSWSPEPVVRELAEHGLSTEGPLFSGLHFYPFGDVARCARWLGDMRAGDAAGPGAFATGRAGYRDRTSGTAATDPAARAAALRAALTGPP